MVGLNLALSLLVVRLVSAASEFNCVTDGVYRNPADCLKFIICAHGQRQDFDCPQGTSWHADRGICDTTDLSKCTADPTATSSGNSEDVFKQHLLSLLADFKPCHAGETTPNPGQGGNGTTPGSGGPGETTPGNSGGNPTTPGNNGGSSTGNPGGNSSPNPDGGNTGTTPGNGGGSSPGNPGGSGTTPGGPTTAGPGQTTPGNPSGSTTTERSYHPPSNSTDGGSSPNPDGGNTGTTPGTGGGSSPNPGQGGNGSTPQPTSLPPPTCPACPIPTEKVCPTVAPCAVCPTTTPTPKKPICDDGWKYNEATNSCYFVDQNPSGQSRTSQIDAQKACLKEKANLASIHSAEENSFILNMVANASRADMNYGAWMGLYRIGSGPNDFTNYDGSSVDFKNFAEGMVDNTGGNEYCVVFARAPESQYNGQWNDLPCAGLQVTYVCKKPANTPVDTPLPTTVKPLPTTRSTPKPVATTQCTGEWSEWTNSPGASCNDTCGNCGVVKQQRTCLPAGCDCIGASTAVNSCSNQPCIYPRANCCAPYTKQIINGALACE